MSYDVLLSTMFPSDLAFYFTLHDCGQHDTSTGLIIIVNSR